MMHGHVTGTLLPVRSFANHPSSRPRRGKLNNQRFSEPEVSSVAAEEMGRSPELVSKDINSRFGLRLRELRLMNNMTQLRMAEDFGIDRSFISDVERGRKSISLHMLEVIAIGLKVSLSDLLAGL